MTDKEQTTLQIKHQITPDPYRFVNLGLFLLVAVSNGLPCQAFAGVGPVISKIYEVSALQTNANSLFYPIMYVVMILPANYVVDTKGIKIASLICQALMCLGLAMRCLINYHFYFFLIGTFICSLGFCFITGTANKFPNIWFLDKQIFIVKSLILFMLFAADTIGYYLSTAFIEKTSSKNDVQTFFIIQSGILMLFHILNAIFFKDKPANPQNYSSQIERQEYFKNLKKLLVHKNYIILFISMTFVFAGLSIVFVGVAWLAEAYDVSTQQCGYILVTANITGLFGCGFSGFFLKHKYKLKCRIFLMWSFFSMGLMWIGFQTHLFWIVILSAALVGFSIFPYLTTMIDFASQATFPVGQATSGGSFLFGGQTFGFIMVIIFSLYINDNVTVQKSRVTQGILLSYFIFSYIFLHFSKEDLKRKQYEDKIKVQQKASLISQQSSFLSGSD